ncbi:MAG: spore coat associated protein CotJA [Clostridia bacterium]|nr:spore coat associated protein CotJA [Clostridia bacterium]
MTPADMGIEYYLKTNTNTKVTNKKREENIPQNSRFNNVMLKDLPLTMAYVPFQDIEGVYSNDEALKAGTLFPNLDKPFLGRKI